jgi:hypothetical protein
MSDLESYPSESYEVSESQPGFYKLLQGLATGLVQKVTANGSQLLPATVLWDFNRFQGSWVPTESYLGDSVGSPTISPGDLPLKDLHYPALCVTDVGGLNIW